ncbi:DUF7261 family protein [Natrialbaceae archaeon A-gly3]
MVANRRDRGQLLLVGAVAVAFIILGVVVIFNGVLYTQTISAGDSVERTDDVDVSERELAEGVRGVVHWNNLAGDSTDWDTGLDTYVNHYEDVAVNDRPVVVTIREKRDTKQGYLDESTISGDETEVFDSDDGSNVGHLALTIETGESATVTIDGVTVSIDLEEEENVITVDNDDCDVDIDDQDHVRFDLTSGTASATLPDDCELDLIDQSAEYKTIKFEDDSNAQYELIAFDDEALENGGDLDDVTWSVDVTYTYDSSDVTYEREMTIPIYGDRP